MKRWLAWLSAGAFLFSADQLSARVEAQPGYTKTQTYNAALRYLRVDLGYEVTERDPDAAYLLFRYVPPGRSGATNGSIEIVDAKQTVRVYVQLPQMPEYHEQVLSDGLARKLRAEYGDPPTEKPPEGPPPETSPKKRRDDGKTPPDPKPGAGSEPS